MNTRRFPVVLMVVCLPVAVMAALPAPTLESVTVGADGVVLDWSDVDGAVKYSVDIGGTLTYTYWDEIQLAEVTATADVEVSFGTSDRTDGGLMSDSNLTITIEELATALAAQLDVEATLISFEGSAAVKALDPGRGKGPQNNPFSNSMDVLVTF